MTTTNTWKTSKLDYLKRVYGPYTEKYAGYEDDRKVFINIYNEMVSALETLPDDPHLFVKVAMNRAITGETQRLCTIIRECETRVPEWVTFELTRT